MCMHVAVVMQHKSCQILTMAADIAAQYCLSRWCRFTNGLSDAVWEAA